MTDDVSKLTILELWRAMVRLTLGSWVGIVTALGAVVFFAFSLGQWVERTNMSLRPAASAPNPTISSGPVEALPTPTHRRTTVGPILTPTAQTEPTQIDSERRDRVSLRSVHGLSLINSAFSGRGYNLMPPSSFAFIVISNWEPMSDYAPPIYRETTTFPEIQRRQDGSFWVVGHLSSGDAIRAARGTSGDEVTLVPFPGNDEILTSIPLTSIRSIRYRKTSFTGDQDAHDIVFK